jgi:mutator family transposase
VSAAVARPFDVSTVDARVALVQALIPVGLAYVGELVVEEVASSAGPRYARDDLGFVQTATENRVVCAGFLRSLLALGRWIEPGILVVIDSRKGLRAAVAEAFGARAVLQRCQWHKRENVVRYLPPLQQRAFGRSCRPRTTNRPMSAPGKRSRRSAARSRCGTCQPPRVSMKASRKR